MAKDESPTIVPGTVLWGTYRAERVIGVGGMGVVVHAVRLNPRPYETKDVAIKFLLPQFAASKEAATRFVREARAVTRIQSDHVAQVLDVGTSDEHGPFIAMEYLAGSDLSRQVRKGLRAPIEVAIDLVAQAADALAHAHAQGVVHRDVKPANLFVADRPARADGTAAPPIVKVLDFGISKLADDADLGVTKTTTVLGSGLYMSPEQMRSAKGVDHRTDIYGLGITLYEVLTGTQPFTAETYPDLCIKVAMDPPDPLRRHRADVPEELAAAIARAYARKAEDRYASIGDFLGALAPWASPATAARIRAIQAIGRPHLRLASSPSIPPPRLDGEDGARERSADMWRDALATPRPVMQQSLPGGLSNTSSGSMTEGARDTSARTVVLTAIGTFVVLAATVAIYVFAIRGPSAASDAATSAEPRASTGAARAAEPHASATADRPSPLASAATPDAVSSASSDAVDASASALPAPSIAAAPPTGWTPPKGATPATVTAPTPTPTPTPTAPPGDPFACVNPVTHLREACH